MPKKKTSRSTKPTLHEQIAKHEQALAKLQAPAPVVTPLAAVPIIEWVGAYEKSWKGMLVDAAYAHPAKASRALLEKIYDYLFQIGALTNDKNMRKLRRDSSGETTEGAFLQQEMLHHLGGQESPKLSERADQKQKGLYTSIESSSPEDARRSLRIRAQTGDGGFSGTTVDRRGSSSSQERNKGRQSDREFRSNDQEGTRSTSPQARESQSNTGRMPMLSQQIDNVPTSKDYIRNIIVDCFGGIGTTAIIGAYKGYNVVCCELEPKFVKLAEANFMLHEHNWLAMNLPLPLMVQGDSRKLREHVQDGIGILVHPIDRPASADIVIASPPYADQGLKGGDQRTALSDPSDTTKESGRGKRTASLGKDGEESYGETEGQLGAMLSGTVDAVVSSPPYAAIATGAGGLNTKPAKDGQQGGRSKDSASQDTDQRYGGAKGQLSRLPESSVDAVVSSPPYVDSSLNDTQRLAQTRGAINTHRGSNKEYGESDGQLATEMPETFWSAARDIVAESYAILKPGGHAVWITKMFIRTGTVVDFPGDWRRLCEHCGFETLTEVRAMQVEETKEINLFGDEEVTKIERKSFFRRLAEKKGSPKIDWETIWIMRKPDR